MDSDLRGKIILLIVLVLIPVFGIVIYANTNKQHRDLDRTTVSAATEETVVLIDTDNSKNTVSFEAIGNNLSHWKKDETFFDNEQDSLAMKLLEEMNTLSLRVFSAERDLRVRVVDYQGNLKTGEKFEIVARNITTHEDFTLVDEDRDGVVYYADLKPAEYRVTIKPYGDYIMPEDAATVIVRENVEFALIEDISLKLYNESDINKEKEDTMVLTASMDADRKLKSSYNDNSDTVYGIDISSNNEVIDWNSVHDSGIRFVILRAGYRGAETGKLIIDEDFRDNVKAAKLAGLSVGAYFFSQAVSPLEAVEEASALLTVAGDLRLSYPLVIRFDMAGGSGRADDLTAEKRTAIAEAFCETIRHEGHEPCIYATKNWLAMNIEYNKLSKNMLWLADFHEPPMYEGYYDIWQYSYKGKVSGINGDVNLSISYIK